MLLGMIDEGYDESVLHLQTEACDWAAERPLNLARLFKAGSISRHVERRRVSDG
jgi:hypothetical protein